MLQRLLIYRLDPLPLDYYYINRMITAAVYSIIIHCSVNKSKQLSGPHTSVSDEKPMAALNILFKNVKMFQMDFCSSLL